LIAKNNHVLIVDLMFSDSCAQPNKHISAHHYENFYENLFNFYSIRYSISVNGFFTQIFLYNIKCLPPSLLPPVEKITIYSLCSFAQRFLKNEYRKISYSYKFYIILCDIKFYVSLFQKIVKKNFFLQ